MRQRRHRQLWLRAVSVVGAIIISSVVTYAALQSQQAVLSGNSIETATAALQLSLDGATYSSTRVGFTFGNIIPGGPAQPSTGNPIWFKNTGSAALNLRVSLNGTPTTTGDVDLSKVFVVLTPVTGGGTAQSLALDSLVSGTLTNGVAITAPAVAAGTIVQYKLQASMAADAFTGNGATVRNLDLVFIGTVS